MKKSDFLILFLVYLTFMIGYFARDSSIYAYCKNEQKFSTLNGATFTCKLKDNS